MTDRFYNPVVPDHVPPHLVFDHNIYDYQSEDPHLAAHRLLRERRPELFWTRNNGGHWIVVGAEAIAAVDRDTANFTTKRMFVPEELNPETPFFIPNQADPPEHGIQRAVINPLFAPNRIKLLSDAIRQTAGEMADEIVARGECEFIADFASKLPVIIFLSLVDLPRGDRAKLIAIAHRVLDPKNEEVRMSGLADLVGYLSPIIEDRRAHPREDVISSIVAAGVVENKMSNEDVVKLCCTVLLGGLDTISASLTYLTRHLAETPEDRQRLVDEPALIPRAIEEVLRRFPVSNIGRQFRQDMVFRGTDVRAADHIVWSVGMSNFDERVFPDPLRVDFDRKRAQHATFGGGIHFCPGATLARTELRIFTEVWLSKIPNFRIRPGAEIRYREGHTITLASLPLVIDRP